MANEEAPIGDDDLGEPIAELRQLEEVPPRGFFDRIARSLHRRTLGSQLATLGWKAMAEVFLEFLKVIHEIVQPSRRTDQGE